ncbi:MAG: aminoglycoside phosphotransferase family protein, partial [Candidatus Nanohalobium sp.]
VEKSRVEAFLETHEEEFERDFQIIERKFGVSNYNFILEADNEKFVLRVSRKVSRRSRLKEEAEALEFLKEQGIKQVPEKAWFGDAEFGSVLIETYVGDKDLEADDFTEKELRESAKLLSEIHSIPISKYNDFFSTEKREKASLKEIYREEYEKWSERPYREYLEEAEEQDERIEQAYRVQKELFESVPEVEVDQRPVHGDLGFNVRSSDTEVFFVDWEYFTTGYPGHDIVYFFEHENLDESQRKIFLDEYREHRELSEIFEENRERYRKFLAFNDAVWAAKRLETGKGDQEKMENILEKKMSTLEDLHGGLSG